MGVRKRVRDGGLVLAQQTNLAFNCVYIG